MTRRGEKMAFVMLEDLTGTVEAIVFSDLYTKTSSLIKSDQPIFFIGNLEVDEEIVRVIAKDIFPIADVTTRLTDSVHFYLSAPECTKQHVLQLQSIISRYPGTCPTVLHFIIPGKSETVMSLPEKLYVKPSLDMAKTMEKVFGRNIVRFEAKNYA
jgi:DNA polymerase-3 subunit alpha